MSAGLAGGLLIAATLAVVTIARYEALRSETLRACDTAAALDLVAFTRLCHDVGYQQIVTFADNEGA